MPTPPHERSALAETARAASTRDAAVRRVRSATRWLLAGAVGLTGALAGVVAQQTLPAKASTPSSSSSSSATGSSPSGEAPSGEAAGTAQGSSDDGGGYAEGQGSYGGQEEGGQGYDDGSGEYQGAPQAPAQAPQQAPQYTPPAVSSGAS